MLDEYIATIGLEVHVQLKTKSKMFCPCKTGFGDEPNSNLCPVCLGLPGALPVLNKHAIELTVLTGKMLNCTTPPISKWDRKSYFYPDMPKNYQISQFDLPLCLDGEVPLYEFCYPKDAQKNIQNPNKKVKLTRIHLEEDVAKSTHLEKATAVDFNRAGTPLMEIVTEPDIDSAEEAFAFLNSLRQILNYGDVSDADMEKGQLRCDVNISVRHKSTEELGAKIELKNLNSVSAVRRSIKYEINRQIELVSKDVVLVQSTLRWNNELNRTEMMRTKEYSHDYRYFPDPDLVPINTDIFCKYAKDNLPKLPHQLQEEFVTKYNLTPYASSVLVSERDLAIFFQNALKAENGEKNAIKICNWLTNNLFSELNKLSLSINDSPISPKNLADLVNLIENNTINANQAKEIVFPLMLEESISAQEVIKIKNLKASSFDNNQLIDIVKKIVDANPETVNDIKSGNKKAISFLVGQTMKETKGKANPKAISQEIAKFI